MPLYKVTTKILTKMVTKKAIILNGNEENLGLATALGGKNGKTKLLGNETLRT
jgi:hypothetical protein